MKKAAIGVLGAVLMVLPTAACATSTTDGSRVSLGSDQPFGGPSNAANTSAAATPKDAAAQQARAAVDRYLSVYNALIGGRESDLDRLSQVAGDPLLSTVRADVIAALSKGVKNRGSDPTVDDVEYVRTDLPDSGRGRADVEVRMCIDQAATDLVYPDGKSARTVGSPDQIARQWWVRNDSYPDTDGWKVVGQSAKATQRC